MVAKNTPADTKAKMSHLLFSGLFFVGLSIKISLFCTFCNYSLAPRLRPWGVNLVHAE